MSELLFVTADAGGNVQPMLGIASASAALGHQVRVVGHEPLRAQVRGSGLEFVPYVSTRPWQSARVQGPLRWPVMLNDRGIATDVTELCRTRRPDAVVIDCMLCPAHHAVAELGLPRVVLTHTLRAYMDRMHRPTRFGGGSPALLYGYRTGDLWDSADLHIVAAHRESDPASTRPQPPNLEWTGAVVSPPRPPAIPDGPPRILVSLSTNGFPGQARILSRIIEALAQLPVRATVTTGGVLDPQGFSCPPNVEITGFVDHAELMPATSLVIGHGGYSTTFRALAHGIPVLVIPAYPFLDQRMVGVAITRAGVGLVLRRRASTSSIRTAVARLLADPVIRARADALGCELRAHDGAHRGAERIQALTG